jgi:SAM-dependent methyltransferase
MPDADSTFGGGRPAWLGRLDKVRNVVRQEMISRQLDKHLGMPPARVLDVGAGQGTQSIRLARQGHQVLAVEPDPDMRAAFRAALGTEPRCKTASHCEPVLSAAYGHRGLIRTRAGALV